MKLLQAFRASAIAMAVVLAPGLAKAATISDSQAISHVGQDATVQGTVSNVHVSGKGTVFINFGAQYPNQDFTAVIFSSSAGAFGDAMRLEGKKLAVTGPITMWKGKPEMILRSPSQLRAVP
jgi:DNA/RNA endonuclease YhcR with UshA esterase domain